MRRYIEIKTIFAIVIAVMLLITGCSKDSSQEVAKGTVYNDYGTYVFFGVDSRAEGDDWINDQSTGSEGAPSSDVIMLLTVDKESKEAKIISVYRDTMLDVAGDGSDFEKCNTAYRESGPYGAIDMLEKNLDLHIDGYATANFMTVADAIDMLGGVTVDVEDENTYDIVSEKTGMKNVVDTTNGYIKEMNRIYNTDTPLLEQAGEQTLTGLQAVAYSRVRYTEGSDRKRAERQRNVVFLMAQKLKDSDTETQHKVIKEMYKEIDTDLDESELSSLFDSIIGYDLDELTGFPFFMTNIIDDIKGEMLVPCDLKANVTKLHSFMYDNDEYLPSDTVLKYDKLITEETGFEADDVNEALTEF